MGIRFFLSLVVLLVTAAVGRSEVLSAAEYYVGVDPGVGAGTPLVVESEGSLGAALNTALVSARRPPGTHTVGVRVQDAAGQWSNALIRRFTVHASNFTLAGGVNKAGPANQTTTETVVPRAVAVTTAEY